MELYDNLLAQHNTKTYAPSREDRDLFIIDLPDYYLWHPWATIKSDFAEQVQSASFSIVAILVGNELWLVIRPENHIDDRVLHLILNGSELIELTLNQDAHFDVTNQCYKLPLPEKLIESQAEFWLEILFDNQLIHYQRLRRLASVKKELGHAHVAKIEQEAFFIFVVPPAALSSDKPRFLGQIYALIDDQLCLPLRCKAGVRKEKPAWFLKFPLAEQLADGRIHHIAVQCGDKHILAQSFFIIGNGVDWLSGAIWREGKDMMLSLSDSQASTELTVAVSGCSRKIQSFVLRQTNRVFVFDSNTNHKNICRIKLPRCWLKKQHKIQFEVNCQQDTFRFTLAELGL